MKLMKKIAERMKILNWLFQNAGDPLVASSFRYPVGHIDFPDPFYADCEFMDKINVLKKISDPDSGDAIDRFLAETAMRQQLKRFSYILKWDVPARKYSSFRTFQNEKKIWQKQYPFRLLPSESLFFHHGLRYAPEQVKQYINGKVFIDGGSCFGDSALAMLQYAPSKILAFDISRKNASVFNRVMKNNQAAEKTEMIAKGLGNREMKCFFSDTNQSGTSLSSDGNDEVPVIPLDSMLDSLPPVGFVKMDLEGAGYEAVEGASALIRRDLPVLSLCIYHNQREFFGIPNFLHELVPEYQFAFRANHWNDSSEFALLAWPRNISENWGKY